MKQTYTSPITTSHNLASHIMLAFSGGSPQTGITISSEADDTADDNRAKSDNGGAWEFDWE
ncbi:MAG: hypothetical protein IJS59_01690 [Bacteroidaceae bacterium]|nr:hypothetical protein [Bacteroidaceae bacterium]